MNWSGFQVPFNGDAYIGIYCLQLPDLNGREYIATELTNAIEVGIRYQVSFWVSVSNNSRFAISTIGGFISRDPLISNNFTFFDVVPQILKRPLLPITDTLGWVLITDTFESNRGGERYLTIGNFNTDATSDTVLFNTSVPFGNQFAYYYIDDVSVIALDSVSGVEDQLSMNNGQLSIHPNPAGEAVRIQVTGRSQQKAIRVTDAIGRTVHNLGPRTLNNVTLSGVEEFELSVTDLPSGIYTVSVHLIDGTILHERLVVQHR